MKQSVRPIVIYLSALMFSSVLVNAGFAFAQLTREEAGAIRGGCVVRASAGIKICGQPGLPWCCEDSVCNEYVACLEIPKLQESVVDCAPDPLGIWYIGPELKCGLKLECQCPLPPGQSGAATCASPGFYSYTDKYISCVP